MLGPGKYDDICTHARSAAGPDAEVALIVLNGTKGSGFAVQMRPHTAVDLPRLLHQMADQITADMQRDLQRDLGYEDPV